MSLWFFDVNLRKVLNKIIDSSATGAALEAEITAAQMAAIPAATTSIDLKDAGIADLTGLDKLPATVTTLNISNTADSTTKNTFKHVKLGSGVTNLTMDKTNAFDMSEITAKVTTLSAKDLEITTGDAKRIKINTTAGAKTEVVPTSLVKFPAGKTMQVPTDVKFGAKGATGAAITGSTAAKIEIPTGGKEAGDYTLTFKFADAVSGSEKISGTVTQEYKIIDPSNLDKSALTSAVAEASKLVEADYTPETWTDFKDMLDIAKQISTNVVPDVNLRKVLNKIITPSATGAALEAEITAAQMATITATEILTLKDAGIADLTGLDKLPATVTKLDISNTASSTTKNTFKHVILSSGVTSLTMDRTNAFDMSAINTTKVTTLSATNLEITTGDAKRIKKAAAGTKTEVDPKTFVKFPSGKTMANPTDVKFGAKGETGSPITGSTAAKIEIPTGDKEGDYTLEFAFKDNATSPASPVVTGTVTQEYKIVDISNLNKSALTSAVAEASKLVEADYTPETWTDFKDMLDIAKQISTNVVP